MRVLAYIRNLGNWSDRDYQHKRQRLAVITAAEISGLPIPESRDGVFLAEPVASSDTVFKRIVASLEPADALLVATVQVFGDTPSKLVTNLSKAVSTGARIVVADMPEMNVAVVRKVAMAFTGLEERAAKLETEVDTIIANRAADREQYAKDLQRSVFNTLLKAGISLEGLLDPEGGAKPVADPIRGTQLRKMREELELRGEDAGRLLEAIGEKALGKGAVSEIERGKDTGAKADAYETALRAEVARRKAAARVPIPATDISEAEAFRQQIKEAGNGDLGHAY